MKTFKHQEWWGCFVPLERRISLLTCSSSLRTVLPTQTVQPETWGPSWLLLTPQDALSILLLTQRLSLAPPPLPHCSPGPLSSHWDHHNSLSTGVCQPPCMWLSQSRFIPFISDCVNSLLKVLQCLGITVSWWRSQAAKCESWVCHLLT